MKASFFSITILLACLPTVFSNFNISSNVSPVRESMEKPTRYFGRFFENRPVESSAPIAFGAKLGKYIKETQIGEADYQIRTVVIDPGHGGRDGGCSGTNTQEKTLALNIALKLGRQMKAGNPHIRVLFTRMEDVFVR